MAELSPLRRRMIEDMTVRNLSPATQRSYINAVQKFSRHFGRSPDRLDLEDVHALQVHLVSTGISWASLNQIVCALRFFYGITLGQNDVPERIPYARKPRTLPVILSADEVVQFLEAVSSLKARVALTCAYAGRGSLRVEGGGYRQLQDGDPCPSRQIQQSPLCHAVCRVAGNSAQLLASGASRIVPVPGT